MIKELKEKKKDGE